MYKRKSIVDKKRLNTYIPESLYNLVRADYKQLGISPSHIVSMALQEYYSRHSGAAADVKGQAEPSGAAIRR